jgi:antitoxin (DNA-binding transcriptional repressor) of toxin-antitoxin stability system
MTTLPVAYMDDVLRVSATEFKARCLAIFKDLEARRVGRVLVTRRGRPVAELTPPRTELPTLWGAHRGSVEVELGIDLTASVLDEALDAAVGVLHR